MTTTVTGGAVYNTYTSQKWNKNTQWQGPATFAPAAATYQAHHVRKGVKP